MARGPQRGGAQCNRIDLRPYLGVTNVNLMQIIVMKLTQTLGVLHTVRQQENFNKLMPLNTYLIKSFIRNVRNNPCRRILLTLFIRYHT